MGKDTITFNIQEKLLEYFRELQYLRMQCQQYKIQGIDTENPKKIKYFKKEVTKKFCSEARKEMPHCFNPCMQSILRGTAFETKESWGK